MKEIRPHLQETLQHRRVQARERWGLKQALASTLRHLPNQIQVEEEARDPVRDSHLSSELGRISEDRHGAIKVAKDLRTVKKRE
jgi:hypothetical protein